jgi:hypothetical protein
MTEGGGSSSARSVRFVSVVVLVATAMSASCTSSTEPSIPTRVLSPAPSPTGAMSSCPAALARASTISPGALDEVMAGHVPTWLPPGMGLVEAFGPGDGASGGAFFADTRCREVRLRFWDSSEQGDGERMGRWVVQSSAPGDCFNAVLGSARCIDYHAVVGGGSIGVQMMGLEREEADKIVRSIPL